jgi:ribonuclease P protein component
MFPRAQRLTDNRVFTTLFKRGAWVRGNNFSIVFSQTPQTGKIGFVITKKVTKSAVERNRIKRRLRAAFLEVLAQSEFVNVLGVKNLVVVIYKSSEHLSFSDLKNEVTHQLTRLMSSPATPRSTAGPWLFKKGSS